MSGKTRRTLRLPTSPRFWREWLDDAPEINNMQSPGEQSDVISDVINRAIRSAEQAAAVVWYMTKGDARARRDLACEAAERWLHLCEIAAGDDTKSLQVVALLKAEWAAVESTFDWDGAE